MPKHTIELKEDEIRVINVVKSIMDFNNIDDAVSFIVKDYAKTKSYSRFINDKRGKPLPKEKDKKQIAKEKRKQALREKRRKQRRERMRKLRKSK